MVSVLWSWEAVQNSQCIVRSCAAALLVCWYLNTWPALRWEQKRKSSEAKGTGLLRAGLVHSDTIL